MRLTRRGVMLGAGGGGAIVLSAAGLRAYDQGLLTPVDRRPGSQPWADVAKGRLHGPLALAGAAILSSSPHNTQPWRFEVAPDHIDVHLAPERHLGAFDPFRREMMLGVGATVETIVQAAPAQGLLATVSPGDPGSTLFARIGLAARPSEAAPLAAAIPLRRVNRRPYDTVRTVEAADLAALAQQASSSNAARLVLLPADSGAGRRLGALTIDATRRIVADAEMDAWSARWTRHGRAQEDIERSGLVLANTGIDQSLEIASAYLPPLSAETEGRYWLNMTQEAHVPTASGFGLILVRDLYDRGQALEAGRLWQRLNLQGTLSGMAMQPLNQLPECVDRERQLGRAPATSALLDPLLDDPAWRPTFAFRYGQSEEIIPPSPRRALSQVLI